MKIRTESELQDKLDGSLGWRKQEIALLKSSIQSSVELKRATLTRAGMALLYAHWEGFAKESIGFYIDFVATKGLKRKDLSDCFVALSMKRSLGEVVASSKSSIHIRAVDLLRNHPTDKALLPKGSTVHAKSNLNSEVLEDLLLSVGIHLDRYKPKYNFIDESLLKQRNAIAHGDRLTLQPADFDKMADQVISLMEMLKTDIENSATLKTYRFLVSTSVGANPKVNPIR